jgi:hypothetical protein
MSEDRGERVQRVVRSARKMIWSRISVARGGKSDVVVEREERVLEDKFRGGERGGRERSISWVEGEEGRESQASGRYKIDAARTCVRTETCTCWFDGRKPPLSDSQCHRFQLDASPIPLCMSSSRRRDFNLAFVPLS